MYGRQIWGQCLTQQVTTFHKKNDEIVVGVYIVDKKRRINIRLRGMNE